MNASKSTSNNEEDDNNRRMLEKEEMEDMRIKMVRQVTDVMPNMHALVIGPGLGRCPLVMRATADIIREAKNRGLGLVLDADALFLLTLEQNRDLLSGGGAAAAAATNNTTIVLTPNSVEYKRLVATLGEGSEDILEQRLDGVIIVRKGFHDEIIQLISKSSGSSSSSSSSGVFRNKLCCEEEGGLKRCGGLGDILSGIVGLFVAWNKILLNSKDDMVLACWVACCLTKISTKEAFSKSRRSMTAPDVLDKVGSVVDSLQEKLRKADEKDYTH
eukprot:CAMPEP_0184860990 /NCGR_PEP_ID=MMETSP0580-20130426/5772_1 /TAXON_ID=1118495 /ORGANISM="Dactyliosolen fragilissimus" /LENGTH=272 /DNA_ID=CAMNT_0027358307 /DNA_START=713 /DNA_END=1532 /DNA_ORIENTATION=+